MNTKTISYYKLKKEGKIKKMQDYIFNIIKLYNSAGQQLSARDISKITGLPINTVTGRINELRHKRIVKVGGIKFDEETRRSVKWYKKRKTKMTYMRDSLGNLCAFAEDEDEIKEKESVK